MKLSISGFALLLLFCSASFAQQITVVDMITEEPISDVHISGSTQHYLKTNEDGIVDISSLSKEDSISFRHVGYHTMSLTPKMIKKMNYRVEMTITSLPLGELVVATNRWKVQSETSPQKVSTIKPAEVKLQNPQTAADLLAISGKVYIQKSQQGGGSPMIRGFATNRLLYSIDGVRMNTAIFRGGNIQNVISLDPYSIKNTEVIFGPGSVIYGSDAIGGVMSFTTLEPLLSTNDSLLVKGSLAGRYSTANQEQSKHIDISLGWKKIGFATSISHVNYGDLVMGSNGPDDYIKPFNVERINDSDVVSINENENLQTPSGYDQLNIMQKIKFRPSDKLEFDYGFHYSTTSDYGRYDRHLRMRNGLPRYGDWYYGPQKWMMNHLEVKLSTPTKLFDDVKLNLAYQNFEESRHSRSLNKDTREDRYEKVDAASANLDFIKSIDSTHTITYGLEYVNNNVNSIGEDYNIIEEIASPGPARYPNAVWQSYAAFITDKITLSKKLDLSIGVRYNHFSMDADFDTTFYPFPFTKASFNNGALTGSAGVVLKVGKNSILTSNVSTAFRSPNVDDMGKVFDSEPGAVVIPNPNLEAEYAYNGDLGFASVLGRRFKIDGAFYYTYLQNALVRRDYTLNGEDSILYDGVMSKVQAIQNAAYAHVFGVQFGFTYHFGESFYLGGDLNYQRGVDVTEDGQESPSRHAAPMFGNLKAGYRYKHWNVQVYGLYNAAVRSEDMPPSEQGKTEIYALDENGNTYSPEWYTLNLKASYQYRFIHVSAGVENILDKRYKPYSSGIAAPGRNFVISLRLSL
ncbi:TonB-dependent receptor plug domain-containing protein [Parvicella tangerina]|uniref:Vitamin B12 transporter BtuB n=1 Tax=Parvicella tangerina TaxID=2829795 RepID=A0A916JNA7_9FLAO|nr:TonB-dependent receptor [Parvicella tangerina]CAG5080569.1 Vitamin B12 transporter BtuB [Parvicella tangerina]